MDIKLNQTQKSTIKKSIEDTEIESSDKKKERITTKRNEGLKDKVEYAKLNKQVKKET